MARLIYFPSFHARLPFVKILFKFFFPPIYSIFSSISSIFFNFHKCLPFFYSLPSMRHCPLRKLCSSLFNFYPVSFHFNFYSILFNSLTFIFSSIFCNFPQFVLFPPFHAAALPPEKIRRRLVQEPDGKNNLEKWWW